MLVLPPLTYYFWLCLRDHDGALVAPSLGELIHDVPAPTPRALALYGAWLALQIVLQLWAPGRVQAGGPPPGGPRPPHPPDGRGAFLGSPPAGPLSPLARRGPA